MYVLARFTIVFFLSFLSLTSSSLAIDDITFSLESYNQDLTAIEAAWSPTGQAHNKGYVNRSSSCNLKAKIPRNLQ